MLAPIVMLVAALPALFGAWVLRTNGKSPVAQRAALIVACVCISVAALMAVVDRVQVAPAVIFAVESAIVLAIVFALPGIAEAFSIIFRTLRPRD